MKSVRPHTYLLLVGFLATSGFVIALGGPVMRPLQVGAIIAATAFLVFGLWLLSIRGMMLPLNKLTKEIRRIMDEGDIHEHIEVEVPDELGEITGYLNSLIEELRRKTRDVGNLLEIQANNHDALVTYAEYLRKVSHKSGNDHDE
ncbi:MAG: HAMP domain-containing protein, partial [Thermoplasmata archaeon]|nr:HAMP domain-containing protein [Thermoplasmata archaeon]